jgi:2TM family of unknown function (DUF5676)
MTNQPTSGPQQINILAFGWALMATLIILFILCAVAGMIFPDLPLAHGWIGLFTTAPLGSIRNFFDGIVYSALFAWLSAVIFGTTYNRLIK